VLGIDTIADTLSYCDFEFSLGYPFNPCTTYPGYSSYQINSGPVSPCPGGTIFLPSGNYVVRYWSADNCLRLVVNLNITANEVDSLECEREIIIPCEGPMWAAELLSPEMGTGDCDCDYELGDDLEGNVISITQIQDGITKVVKEFKNHTKCNYCLVEFTIIEERCNFNVEFNYTSGSGVGQIPIWRTEPNLPCGTETYTLYDENHNILDTRTHSPAWPIGQVDNFTITQPGGYTIVLEVCNCVCEQACCRKDSVFFQIFEEGGSFTILRMGLFEESGNSGFESQTIAGDSSRLEIILIPNPSSRVFTIGNNSGQELVYEDVIIINSEGKAIKRLENQSSSSLIDMGETPAGEYVVFAKFNGFYYSAKLILIN
jgi:hypothetical protein